MKKLTLSPRLLGLFLAMAIFPAVYSTTYHVNHLAAGANNGTNWENAFTNLTSALAVASSGDVIWVAQGVYKPQQVVDLNLYGGFDPREVVFIIPGGVSLYGGFLGNENALEERDWQTNLTILSGDIDNNDLNPGGNFIAENTGYIVGQNAYHVIYTLNAGHTTRLDGFIVTAGHAGISTPTGPTDPNLNGGGWYNHVSGPHFSSSPTIVNTIFSGNFAQSGGGAFYTNPGPAGAVSSPVFENCVFKGNESGFSGGGIHMGSFTPGTYEPQVTNSLFTHNTASRRGGAVYLVGDHAHFSNTRFENNTVTVISPDLSTLPGSGGAVNLVSSNATFTSCYFIANTSTGNPTGFFEGGGGGAVYISTNEPQTTSLGESSPKFIACGFYLNYTGGNHTSWGGAIVHLCDGGRLLPQYVNCVFHGNQAQNHGGAIANFTRVIGDPSFTPVLQPWFTNSTFTSNHANQVGAAIYNAGYLSDGSQLLQSRLENSLLWNNTSSVPGVQLYNTGNNLVRASLVQNSGGSGLSWDTSLGTDGGSNLDANPGLVNIANPLGPDGIPATIDDGIRQGIASPLINAGNNSAPGLVGITTDYTGISRIAGGTVDIGAYERTGITIPNLDIFWLKDWPKIDVPCLTCPPPWSIYLTIIPLRLSPYHVWDGPAKLIIHQDHAEIKGKLVNVSNPDVRFNVNIKLVKPATWDEWRKSGGTFFALSPESFKTALIEHKNWTYWTLSGESFLEGTGLIRGKLSLGDFPPLKRTGFQFGKGANAWDSDLGMGGYFSYKGKVNYANRTFTLVGKGSLNVDAIPCEPECIPLEGFGNEKAGFLETSDEVSTDVFELSVYPTLVKDYLTIQALGQIPEGTRVSIMDLAGRVIYRQETTEGISSLQLNLKEYKPGVYLIRVNSPYLETEVIRQVVKE